MSRVFFVTGTDTGVGKTAVACGLLRAAARRGLRTLALKPVAAGCTGRDGRLENEDALALMREATLPLEYGQVNPVALAPPIAPHVAAAQVGRTLSVADLAKHCSLLAERDVDWTIVEGAGGWLVPLGDEESLADLCQALSASVILVVGLRLGCLNHALLTVSDLMHRGLVLAGWVANEIDPGMAEVDASIATLEGRIRAPCLGRIPHADDDLVEAISRRIDLDPLA